MRKPVCANCAEKWKLHDHLVHAVFWYNTVTATACPCFLCGALRCAFKSVNVANGLIEIPDSLAILDTDEIQTMCNI